MHDPCGPLPMPWSLLSEWGIIDLNYPLKKNFIKFHLTFCNGVSVVNGSTNNTQVTSITSIFHNGSLFYSQHHHHLHHLITRPLMNIALPHTPETTLTNTFEFLSYFNINGFSFSVMNYLCNSSYPVLFAKQRAGTNSVLWHFWGKSFGAILWPTPKTTPTISSRLASWQTEWYQWLSLLLILDLVLVASTQVSKRFTFKVSISNVDTFTQFEIFLGSGTNSREQVLSPDKDKNVVLKMSPIDSPGSPPKQNQNLSTFKGRTPPSPPAKPNSAFVRAPRPTPPNTLNLMSSTVSLFERQQLQLLRCCLL